MKCEVRKGGCWNLFVWLYDPLPHPLLCHYHKTTVMHFLMGNFVLSTAVISANQTPTSMPPRITPTLHGALVKHEIQARKGLIVPTSAPTSFRRVRLKAHCAFNGINDVWTLNNLSWTNATGLLGYKLNSYLDCVQQVSPRTGQSVCFSFFFLE